MATAPLSSKTGYSQYILEEDFQISAVLPRQVIASLSDAPMELLGLTRLKLAAQKSGGDIVDFKLFEKELAEHWSTIRSKEILSDLEIPLGVGIPYIDELSVTPVKKNPEGIKCRVKLDPISDKLKALPPKILWHAINRMLEIHGDTEGVNEAQVEVLWYRACYFYSKIRNYPLYKPTGYNPEKRGRPFWVKANHERGEIEVVIGSFEGHGFETYFKMLKEEIDRTARRMATGPMNTGVMASLSNHLQQGLRACYRSVELLGINLPKSFAAGFSLPMLEDEADESPLLGHIAYCLPQKSALDQQLICEINPKKLHEKRDSLRQRGYHRRGEQSSIEVKKSGYIEFLHSSSSYPEACLHLAKNALLIQPKDERQFHNMVLCLNEKVAANIFKMIRSFKKSMLPIINGIDQGGLYQFNLQAFPLTHVTVSPWSANVAKTFDTIEWSNTVIREMVGFSNFIEDPDWIQKKLYPHITHKEIEKSLKHLLSMGLIKRDRHTRTLYKTKQDLEILDPKGRPVVDYHRSAINLAIGARGWGIEERSEVFSVTFSCSRDEAIRLREECLRLMNEIFKIEKSVGRPDQIYQVSFQLFNLFKVQKGT